MFIGYIEVDVQSHWPSSKRPFLRGVNCRVLVRDPPPRLERVLNPMASGWGTLCGGWQILSKVVYSADRSGVLLERSMLDACGDDAAKVPVQEVARLAGG